jgi:hypothetical protein
MSFEYDKRWITELEKKTPQQDVSIKVGFIEGTYSTGVNVAQVAWWLENGTDRIYPRYFMQRAIAKGQKEFDKLLEKIQLAIIDGKIKPDEAYKVVGQFLQKEIRKEIRVQHLIDTGRLRQSVTYEVE